MTLNRCRSVMTAVVLLAGSAVAQTSSVPVILVTSNGVEDLLPTAEEFGGYLGRMLNRDVPVRQVPGPSGEYVFAVSASDLPVIDDADWRRIREMGGEAYVLQAGSEQLCVAGHTSLAVRHGAFALLEALGCRWLHPGERWTVAPHRTDWRLPEAKTFAAPEFRDRKVFYAYGYGIDESREALGRDFGLWLRANRLGGLAPFRCGHSYPHTVGAYAEEFKAHPEYFGMTEEGTRRAFGTHESLCYSNPDVARIFIEHRLVEFKAMREANPYAFMVSMDPNDGSSPCYCDSCRALGNGSDQALYLANQVARALRKEYPDAAVGLYLYASHKLPPEKVKPEPNVYGQLAMAFNRTGFTYEELAQGWRAAGLQAMGIREYFGVEAWDWGLPGRGRGSNPTYMQDAIPRYKEWGATSLNAEMNANWGTFGPGLWVAARLLWDVDADVDAMLDDYYTSAFGPAAETMRALHAMWLEDSKLTRSNLHAWLTSVDRARQAVAESDAGFRNRIEDMMAYMHYVVLFRGWERAAATKDRDKAYAALKPLLAFTWRIRERQVVHSYALQRRLVNSGAEVLRPLEDGWRFNDPEAVWKDPTPMTSTELSRLFEQDVRNHPPDDRLVRFSSDLVPLERSGTDETPSGHLRRTSVWHVRVPDGRDAFSVRVEDGGLRGIELRDTGGVSLAKFGGIESEGENGAAALEVPAPGLYTVVLNGGQYRPVFPGDLRVVGEASIRYPFPSEYFGSCYCYVPRGTKTVLVKPGMRFSVQAPSWKARRDYYPSDEGPRECVEIPVGEDGGKLWRVDASTRGAFYFLNIPPYVALDPGRMLVPADVVVTAAPPTT